MNKGLTLRRFAFPLLLLFFLAACKGGGGGGASSVTGPSSTAAAPVGYSHVLKINGARALEVANAGGRLVMAEANTDGPSTQDIRAAADVMRRAGGTLLLVGLNWNDAAGRRWSLAQYLAHVRDLRDVVETPGVLFEPIAEPWVTDSARADAFFREGAAIWRTAGGIVVGPLQHPCTLDQTRSMLMRGELTVMDCSPVLASRLDEATVKQLVRLAAASRASLLLYDTFAEVGWNSQVVRWLGEALNANN